MTDSTPKQVLDTFFLSSTMCDPPSWAKVINKEMKSMGLDADSIVSVGIQGPSVVVFYKRPWNHKKPRKKGRKNVKSN